jgi:hypothetical protein
MEVQNNSGSDPGSYSKNNMVKVGYHFYHFNQI